MLADREKCTGCGACAAVCESGAILWKSDIEGFEYPYIDIQRCTECGQCGLACPERNKQIEKVEPEAYAFKNKEWHIREKSSSGGFFYTLASQIINQGGSVYGAAFVENFAVQHIRVDNQNDLWKLQGSKYVQSDCRSCYEKVICDLNARKWVLFTGTPCQIDGINRTLHLRGINKERLILCDLVCHGVPSPAVWREYCNLLKEENNGDMRSVRFRAKENGWHAPSCVRAEFEKSIKDIRFMDLFLDNYILREACHHCQYTTVYRTSDLTMGDFWGIENSSCKEMDDDKGISLILVHTDKGKRILEQLAQNVSVEFRKCSLEEARCEQSALKRPWQPPTNKNDFWIAFFRSGFTSGYCKCYENNESKQGKCLEGKIPLNSVVVITPDGPGSKGDEAIVRGVCNVFSGEKLTLLSPGKVNWEFEVSDIADQFVSVCMPLHEMAGVLNRKVRLIVAGTDLLDGTCGMESSLLRLDAMDAVLKAGGSVRVFCSFRNEVNKEILERIQKLSGDVEFYLREERSLQSFVEQTGRKGKYFPDFAYFCKPLNTMRSQRIVDEIRAYKKDKDLVCFAIDFSEQSFKSLFREGAWEKKQQYVVQVMENIRQTWPDAEMFMLSHDSRKWENHWSDGDFAELAYQYGLAQGWNVHLIPESMKHAELLSILPEMDFVISGRMHLSVAAIRSGVLPIVYTGSEKDGRYNMSDKVCGMLQSRIGYPELKVSSLTELKEILKKAAQGSFGDAWNHSEEKKREDQVKLVQLRQDMGLREDQEVANLDWLDLLLELGDKATAAQNKSIGKAELEESRKEICRLNEELNQVGSWGQRTDKELNETRELLDQKNKELNETKQMMKMISEELDRIKNSHSWKMMQPVWKMRDIIIPYGSRRRKLLKLVYKVIRHPKRALKAVNRARIKKLFSAIKHGDMLLLEEQFTKVIGGTDIRVEPVQVLVCPESESIKDYDEIVVPATDKPLVSIVIPVYNQFNYTYKCIKSIVLNSGNIPYEIIVADDCSTDLTQDIHEKISGVRVAKTQTNLRFLLNCNNAAKSARGKYILFLNNDTQVQENWLQPLVDLIERDEKIGMVGSKLIYPDGRLQEAGGILWRDGSAWNYGNRQDPAMPQYNYVKEVDYISGAAIMIRRTLWKQLGGFDERFAPAYCEDSDLAFMVRDAGYRVLYQPKSVVVHFEGVSNGTDTSTGLKAYQVTNQKKFCEKWKHVLVGNNENAVNVFNARDKSIGKKTILFVDHYVPTYDKDAGSRTVFAYLKMFVEQGFNVKFIGDNFYQSEPYTTTLQQMGIEVLYGSWYAQNWKQWIRENGEYFDYAFLNRPHISVNYIDFLRENTKAKIIYYGHDLHFLRVMREYELTKESKLISESESWKKKEFSLMHKADMSYYPSEVEAQAVREVDPSIRVKAIPAYLFDDVNDADYEAAKRQDLFFIGGFAHGPNVDAVKWLAAEVMPRLREKLPNIQVHVAGSGVTNEIRALEGNGLIIEGRISDEQLEQFYATCRLNIVPLRYGAGIKGKVVESMRYGLPVVTTSCGAEGILNAQECLCVADTAEEFAECIVSAYLDEERLKSMSHAGTAYVRAHYSTANAISVLRDEFSFK